MKNLVLLLGLTAFTATCFADSLYRWELTGSGQGWSDLGRKARTVAHWIAFHKAMSDIKHQCEDKGGELKVGFLDQLRGHQVKEDGDCEKDLPNNIIVCTLKLQADCEINIPAGPEDSTY